MSANKTTELNNIVMNLEYKIQLAIAPVILDLVDHKIGVVNAVNTVTRIIKAILPTNSVTEEDWTSVTERIDSDTEFLALSDTECFALNGKGECLIGYVHHRKGGMYSCINEDRTLDNITHYIPLTSIIKVIQPANI